MKSNACLHIFYKNVSIFLIYEVNLCTYKTDYNIVCLKIRVVIKYVHEDRCLHFFHFIVHELRAIKKLTFIDLF